jgi:RNase H-fold protein (predicted Holliday junction resolvase)
MTHRHVLAIDPGRDKCGLAVLDATDGLLARAVVSRGELMSTLREWCERYRPELLLLGSGTGSRQVRELLIPLSLPVQPVSEWHTTRSARQRYFADHPRRGWRRLLPASLQTPPVPVDDYAAWILAEQFLNRSDP